MTVISHMLNKVQCIEFPFDTKIISTNSYYMTTIALCWNYIHVAARFTNIQDFC
jgi:hypothetical protein